MYNDGRPVEPEKHRQSQEELIARFGALELKPGSMHGIWVHEGQRYEDELLLLTVDVEDTIENRTFFVEWKPILRERFQQIEIYIRSYPVEVI
jgi:hypothetical protein